MKFNNEDSLKKKTMKLSIKEGCSASVMSGFGDAYLTPYALSLNASNIQIGFLSSFAGILGPISQIYGSKMMEKYSRKKIMAFAVLFHALMWIPILLLGLFFWKDVFKNYLPIILIVFYSIYAIFGAIAGPPWFSLLGDVVPEKIRGKYFSKRNRICGTVALVATLAASFVLDFFKTKGLVLVGFSILFSIACIFRLISAWFLTKHYEPKLKLEKGYYFSFFDFVKKAHSNNFGKFVIYITLIHFAANIAGPFFAVYMLKDLNFNYFTFTLINISASLFTLVILPFCGKFSDKYGNRTMIKIGSFLIPFIPILWIFSSNPTYLILIPQLVSGVGWAFFNLGASNFIYDCVSKQRRAICVAYLNVLAGIGVFLGAILGGFLVQHLESAIMNKFLVLFLISGLARMLVVILIFSHIREVRTVRKFHVLIQEFRILEGISHKLSSINSLMLHSLHRNTINKKSNSGALTGLI